MTQAKITNQFTGSDTNDTSGEIQKNNPNCNTTESTKKISAESSNAQANNIALNQNKIELVFNITATKANVNKLQSNDTLLKYIYKDDKIKTVTDKENGHFRNSLKRRKRSEYTPQNQNIQNPANFNYSTVHDLKNKGELNDHVIRADFIQSADLADYNIETLHSNSPITENYSQHRGSLESNAKTNLRRQNDEKEDLQNSDEDTSRNEETSLEETDNKLSSNESKVSDSGESYEKSGESSKEYRNENSKSEEFTENGTEEKHYPNEEPNNKYKQHSSNESSEKYEFSENNPRVGVDTNIFDSKDNSANENSDENQSLKTEYNEDNSSFIESSESPHNSPFAENKSNFTSEKQSNKSDSDPNSFLVSSLENSEEKSQTHINDDEVKPVIELNNEDNSDELSKEIRDGPHSLPLQNNGKKFHGKDFSKNEDNVKQQFERIPLNYKHKDKQIEKDDPTQDNSETLENNSNEVVEKLKTLNSSTSDNERYDKNLNFKFDDVSIKLPEIKLPDDILDYAYEPTYKYEDDSKTYKPIKTDKKWPYHTYKPETDDYGLDLDSYNKKRKSKYNDKITDRKNEDKSDEDDDSEDLYEKFVRERFGKRGSFAKRSEKLKIKPDVDNQELLNTIQNVLKRTEDIEKEADTSADPNAKYLWTLEYGDKL